MKRKDLLTGEEFIAQRINQKFAKPQNRIKYYNDKANRLRQSNSWIDRPLHKSICILNDLLRNKQEAVFHKQYLLGRGFSFETSTHLELYQGKRYPAIYQYLIVPITPEQIKIVKK
jgi:hypothetical protein